MAAIDMDADVSMIWHLLLDAGIATEEQLEALPVEQVFEH